MNVQSSNSIRFEVAIELEPDPAFIHESPTEYVTLAMPLYSGSTRVSAKKSVVYEGKVAPGMLRVGLPGDRVTIMRPARARALFVGVPAAEYARFTDETKDSNRGSGILTLKPIIRPDAQVKAIARAFISVDDLHGSARQVYLAGLSQSLLAILAEAHNHPDDLASWPTHQILSPKEERLARDWAEARLGEGINLHDWAQELGLATSEFSRRFHATAGAAPYAWFLERRIERAQDMLLIPSKSLVEIALDLGFCSQSHFTKVFRQRVGTAPARWRALHGAAGS